MKDNYLQDIQAIKTIMEERTRFLSLSGLSGILSGIYALVGAFLAHSIATNSASYAYKDLKQGLFSPVVIKLLALAVVLVLLSVVTAYILSRRKARKNNDKMWTSASKKALRKFMVPLFTGGLFVILLIWRGELLLVAPATLIFYGLSLYAASDHTVRDIATLGIAEIILGLVSLGFAGHGLYFWAAGFGVLHIIYGLIMYIKYDRLQATEPIVTSA